MHVIGNSCTFIYLFQNLVWPSQRFSRLHKVILAWQDNLIIDIGNFISHWVIIICNRTTPSFSCKNTTYTVLMRDRLYICQLFSESTCTISIRLAKLVVFLQHRLLLLSRTPLFFCHISAIFTLSCLILTFIISFGTFRVRFFVVKRGCLMGSLIGTVCIDDEIRGRWIGVEDRAASLRLEFFVALSRPVWRLEDGRCFRVCVVFFEQESRSFYWVGVMDRGLVGNIRFFVESLDWSVFGRGVGAIIEICRSRWGVKTAHM